MEFQVQPDTSIKNKELKYNPSEEFESAENLGSVENASGFQLSAQEDQSLLAPNNASSPQVIQDNNLRDEVRELKDLIMNRLPLTVVQDKKPNEQDDIEARV